MLLSEITTMRVGGAARELVRPTTAVELVAATLEVWGSGEPWLVLGGGSNVVVADAGFDGSVIHIGTSGIERVSGPTLPVPNDASASGGRAVGNAGVRVRVQAGEPWDAVVAHAVANGWAGIEALSGIPGSSGAAPIQNIGAYGQELGDTLVAIDFLDYESGEVVRVLRDELGLGYRTSGLKRGRQGVVVAIELELAASTEGSIAYPQLAQALGVPLGATVPLVDIRAAVLALRASKGMVLDPADPDSVSCGSFFTNPIVSENFARGLPRDAPRWPVGPQPADVAVPLGEQPAPVPASDDRVKLSAAWLIERAGISRGFALPGSSAAISSKHTLAIVNRGGATAEEVAQLARLIRTRVLAEFGVTLHPEPVPVGIQI
jgi:UDP-N-acetylmuramate dehydrogenase